MMGVSCIENFLKERRNVYRDSAGFCRLCAGTGCFPDPDGVGDLGMVRIVPAVVKQRSQLKAVAALPLFSLSAPVQELLAHVAALGLIGAVVYLLFKMTVCCVFVQNWNHSTQFENGK